MTKKDFQLIASVFSEARSAAANPMARQTGDALAVRMAKALKTTNSRFDVDRFLDACGVPR